MCGLDNKMFKSYLFYNMCQSHLLIEEKKMMSFYIASEQGRRSILYELINAVRRDIEPNGRER